MSVFTERDLAPPFSDAGIMEVVEIIATFNYTNRLANTLGFKPNDEFFTSNR